MTANTEIAATFKWQPQSILFKLQLYVASPRHATGPAGAAGKRG